MPMGRIFSVIAAVGAAVYVISGASTYTNEKYQATAEPSVVWTTISPLPTSAANPGCAEGIGDQLFVSIGPHMLLYDGATASWTTLTPPPTSRFVHAIGANSGELILALGILNDPTNILKSAEGYRPNTDTWTTKTAAPTARYNVGSTSNGDRLWVVGTAGSSTLFEEYHMAIDAWTTKARCPANLVGAGCAYVSNRVITFAGNPTILSFTHSYEVSTDQWTTVSPRPVEIQYHFDMTVAAGDVVYAFGGANPPTITSRVDAHSYSYAQDQWTTLDNAPEALYAGAAGVLSSGLIVVAGDHPGLTQSYSYQTPWTASVTGDPLVKGFSGVSRHLNLYTGVFNFLTTPTMVVNGLVEHVSYLPPEEDTVVTMLGVVAVVNECVVAVYTSVAEGGGVDAAVFVRVFACDRNDLNSSVVTAPTRLTVTTADMIVEVECLLMYYRMSLSSPLLRSSYINFFAHTHSTAAVGGLMGHLSTGSVDVSQYEVVGGCLFAVSTAATEIAFSRHSYPVGC